MAAILSLDRLPSEIALEERMVRHFGVPDADPHLRLASVGYTVPLIREFENQGTAGAALPWAKTHHTIRLRSGEVSLWPGINGHGKSLLTSHVALDLVAQGKRIVIASLEMQPVKTLKRMARQAIGNSNPSQDAIVQFVGWLERRLWLYDQHGRADAKFMLSVMRYAAIELRVEHFFLDSLMMVTKGEEDYDGQKDFVTELCAAAHDTGLHIHLVHHTRKLKDENEIPGKFDAKGSGSISDQVDNVFTVWRNKRKEAERQNGQTDESKPDAVLVCDKQRHGEWEGRVGLWFNPESLSYRGDERQGFSRGYNLSRQQEEPGSLG
jgi:twinkle protein